jgi:hypothetical protein
MHTETLPAPELTHLQKLQLANGVGIVLMNVNDSHGRRGYVYMMCNREQVIELTRVINRGESFLISDYGDIICSGLGEDPSPEHQAYMEDWYQFKH